MKDNDIEILGILDDDEVVDAEIETASDFLGDDAVFVELDDAVDAAGCFSGDGDFADDGMDIDVDGGSDL